MNQDRLTWAVHPTVVEKQPLNGEEPQALTKATFWGGMAVTWESPACCPSLGSALNSNRGPQSETLWDLDVAKSDCHILSSIRGKTSKSPPQGLEKCQQNCKIKGHIHEDTKQWKLDGTEGIMLHWIHKVGGKKVEVGMLALHSKKRRTQPWLRTGKYSYLAPQPIAVILSRVHCKVNERHFRKLKGLLLYPIIFPFHRHCGERHASLNQ